MENTEYTFGILNENEVVMTKGSSHTDLSGFQQTERTFPDQTITDSFRVIKKEWSSEDSEGNCYDRYVIDRHYRVIDKTKGVRAELAQTAANLDYLCMMTDISLPSEADEIEMGGDI